VATTLNKKVSQALTQSRAVKAAQVARPAPPPPQRFGSRLTAPTPPARTAPPPQPRTVAPPPQQQTTAQRFGQRLATPAPVPQPRAVAPPARTTTPPQQQPVQQPARLGSGLTPPPVVGKNTQQPPQNIAPPLPPPRPVQDPRQAVQTRYEDWIRANRPDAVANNYGRNYAEIISPEQEAYNQYIRSQGNNQAVYDQYAQYQNKAWNDYYATARPGTAEYDAFNPYILRPQTTDIRFAQQDALGTWQNPRPALQPGDTFDQWYNTIYQQPGYQQLSNINRVQPKFEVPDWMRVGFTPHQEPPYAVGLVPGPIDPNAGMNIQPVATGFQGFTPA
jgi:hypothetical protein